MEDKIAHGIEYGFLAMAVIHKQSISSFACLVRTDYNFAFALLCYYLWYTSKDDQREPIGKKLILLNVFLLVLDLVWLIAVGGAWSSIPALQKYSGVHSFSLLMSWLNFVLRVGILIGLGYLFKHAIKDPKSLISGEIYNMDPIN